jgi:hypothetical protein
MHQLYDASRSHTIARRSRLTRLAVDRRVGATMRALDRLSGLAATTEEAPVTTFIAARRRVEAGRSVCPGVPEGRR